MSVLVTLIGALLSTACFFMLSGALITQNDQRRMTGLLDMAQAEIKNNLDVREEATQTLNRYYIAVCNSVSLLVGEDPTLAEASATARLQAVADKLKINEVLVINGDGIVTASNITAYLNHDMHSNAQSAEFMQILGDPATPIVQEARSNAILGVKFQYIGVARTDEPGVIQIGLAPAQTESALRFTDLSYTLSTLKNGECYVFATDASGVVIAHPDDTQIGEKLDMPQDGGVLQLSGERRIVYSRALEDGTVIVSCIPEYLSASAVAIGTLIFLVCALLIFVIFTLIAYFWLNANLFKGIGKLTALAQGQESIDDDGKGLGTCREIADLTENITALRRKVDDFEQSSAAFDLTDKTGVASKLSFSRSLENEWDRAVRDGSSLSMIAVSIDKFERFSDSDDSVDLLLQALADMLDVTAKRPADVVGHVDDNLFCVLLPVTREDGALLVAEHVLKAAAQIEPAGVSVSIGVATMIPAEGAAPTELALRAETALENAEGKGGGRASIFSVDTESHL